MTCENCNGDRWIPAGSDHGFGPSSGVGYACADCNADGKARYRDPDPMQVRIEDLWRAAGGEYHGPNVEHGTIEKDKLDLFLRQWVGRVDHLELVHERLDRLGVDPCAGADCRVGARFDRLLQDALAPILKRSGDIDLTTCTACGCLIFTAVPDGLAICDPCAAQEAARQDGGGA